MGVQVLAYRDTQPVLEVALLNPDLSPVDLTGSTIKLHLRLSDGSTKLIRDMVIQGAPTLGIVRYPWTATDWDAASGTTVDGAYPVGGLAGATPSAPIPGAPLEHKMKYEVINGASRGTFPNKDEYDVLRISDDIGQGN